MTSIRRNGTTMKPVSPTMRVTIAAANAIWKAAKPPVKPFWAEYMTVTSPSSVPIIVAIARNVFKPRPATIKSVTLLMYRLI